MTLGWKLDPMQRGELLARFPPRWPDVVADHVTLDARAAPDAPLPVDVSAVIVGIADDDAGVQAMVVTIDGTADRPDGGTYHITWSLDRARGRRAVESNRVIADHGWQPVEAVPVTLVPARW